MNKIVQIREIFVDDNGKNHYRFYKHDKIVWANDSNGEYDLFRKYHDNNQWVYLKSDNNFGMLRRTIEVKCKTPKIEIEYQKLK